MVLKLYPDPNNLDPGSVTLEDLAALAANSVIGNATGSSATPTAVPLGTDTGASIITRTGTQTLSAKKISLTVPLGTDDTYEGTQIVGLVNLGGVTQWEAVTLNSSSQWVLADANGAGLFPARGIAVATALTTVAVTVLVNGVVRNDAWNWTPGGAIYLSATPGAITQTAPSTTGDNVQQVGYAITADIAFFDFNSTFVEVP